MPHTLLIVDDEKHTRDGLAQIFDDKFDVFLAKNPDEAFALMDAETFDIILTDLKMGAQSGMSVVDKAISLSNKPICIMMTAYGNIETAVEAMKRGAYDFLSKPINVEKLEILVQRAIKDKFIASENRVLHKKLSDKYHVDGILGQSDSFRKILDQVEKIANSKASVLITGETGTGKELIANLIHNKSGRSEKAFVGVHCAALPNNLLETELFGHEKGAFTGAINRRIGKFESANGGTLFLDEIGEIEPAVQVKLLRFLETRTIERIGSNKTISIDTRLICATHRNLEQEVSTGKFREDLMYRLNVVNIHLPSLRERKDDIPILLKHYLNLFSAENGVSSPKINNDIMTIISNYNWPGNVRELRNFAEHLVVMYRGNEIKLEFLSDKFLKPNNSNNINIPQSEAKLIENALKQTNGNKTKAAQLLGINRRTLHRKLNKGSGP